MRLMTVRTPAIGELKRLFSLKHSPKKPRPIVESENAKYEACSPTKDVKDLMPSKDKDTQFHNLISTIGREQKTAF